MRLQTIILYIGGVLTVVVAAMNVGLPAISGWYREIKQLTMQARKTIADRSSFLILLLLIIAFLTFVFPDSLQSSDAGRALLLLMGLYWLLRAVWRFAAYPKGALTTTVSIVYLVAGVCFLLALIP
jgi:hypothetical protein